MATDSVIDGLIANLTDPASPGGTAVSRSEMVAILNALKEQISLTDLGTPVPGKVAKVTPEGAWAQLDDDTTAAGSGWDSNATITADRTILMGNRTITLKNTGLNNKPALMFETDLTTNGVIEHWRVKSPTETKYGRDFGLLSVVSQNPETVPDPLSFNEVAKLGFNPDRFWQPTRNGWWDAWEPHWISGDLLYLERHISADIAAFPGENRMYSILAMIRASWAASDVVHLWRGTSYNFKDQLGEDYFSFAKIGADGAKFNFIGPTKAALILEVGGSLNNGFMLYPFDNGGVMDLLNNKWSRWYFRNTKINTEGNVYASQAAAISGGLAVGDHYVLPDGSIKRVMP